MALEPITRQEKIIAGSDLQPITRMEMFLKEYGGASSWNDLGEKTTTTTGDTLTWDGNTEGKICVANSYYHVSDAIPTLNDAPNGLTDTFTYNDGSTESSTVSYDQLLLMYQESGIIYGDCGTMVIPYDNWSLDAAGVTFPKAGIYFIGLDGEYTSSLTIPGYGKFETTKTVIIPLDEKYMPVLTSPNGTKYKITVADDGTISATAV